jgi:hypothetical protein
MYKNIHKELRLKYLMDIFKIKIGKIQLDQDKFVITDTKGKLFTGFVTKGSVNFKVYNENNEEVNISNLEEDNVIKIQTYESNSIDSKEHNNSLIKKIIIKNKYIFNLESSDEFESDNEKNIFN